MDEVSLIIRRARRGNSKNIDLSNRNLTSVPLDLLKITTLETLNLSHNMIISLPDSITDLENLTSIDLSHNEITSLPASILLLPLHQLNLTSNPLNLGNLYGSELKSTLSSLFSNSKPLEKPQTPLKRPGTSGSQNRIRPKEEEKVENKATLQGVTQVDYQELNLGEIISQGGFSVVHKGLERKFLWIGKLR